MLTLGFPCGVIGQQIHPLYPWHFSANKLRQKMGIFIAVVDTRDHRPTDNHFFHHFTGPDRICKDHIIVHAGVLAVSLWIHALKIKQELINIA